jgi:alkylation response protein AidB-like acyl-CoA dehydrogenase
VIYNAPVKDMMFLLEEWIGVDRIAALPGYEDVDADTLRFILEEAGRFCSQELLPINRAGDEHGAVFADGAVTTPPGFREAYLKFIGNGWSGLDAEPEHGGQGLPRLVQFLVDEMLGSCNIAFKLYAELTHGAYHLMASEASDEIRELYLPQMVAGTWSGTMCLTEAHSGTDLGLLNTKATRNDDGTYCIAGTKIFITSGDHDLTENILHLVLARLDDAPAGVRGISLFLVPKVMVKGDGTLGERNAVNTASIEHKMGIRGSATCVLNFDGATAYLVGAENRGLAAMFKMMNLERITVGIQGLGVAEVAYQNALEYARERVQSKAPPPRPDDTKAADPILYQPDIKRKLLKIRAQVEGARALAVFAGFQADVMVRDSDPARREAAEDFVSLLTPVIKSFLSDLGVSSAIEAQQVFGGHGYVREHGMEQLVRDGRICQIYEGTNEVQAVDLVKRKLTMHDGRLADRWFARWDGFFAAREDDEALAPYTGPAQAALGLLKEATAHARETLARSEAEAMGFASDYQRLFGLVALACFWAEIAALVGARDSRFSRTKRLLAGIYMQQVLPEAIGLHEIIMRGAGALADFGVGDFED